MRPRILLPLAVAPLLAFAAAPDAPKAPAEAKPAVEAPAAPFTVGVEAPALLPEKWLKGDPVTAFEKGKVYLVECWATWCGPCVAAIPHVNALHNKFKDKGLVVIGANVMENAEKKAADFVAAKGDGMAYRVAYDGKTGNIAKAWLEAAGVRGIPHAFAVRDGKMIWHGHPGRLNEENVAAMLAGKFDGGAEVAKADAAEAAERTRLAAYRTARNEIRRLIREKNTAAALAKVDESAAVLADTDPSDPHLLRGIIRSESGETAAALAHYKLAAEAAGKNPQARFRLAGALLKNGTARDNALALESARIAAHKGCPSYVTLLLAQAEYAAGDKEAALRILDGLTSDNMVGDAARGAREAVKSGAAWPEVKWGLR